MTKRNVEALEALEFVFDRLNDADAVYAKKNQICEALFIAHKFGFMADSAYESAIDGIIDITFNRLKELANI